jgi:hypothetical protein
MIIIGGGYAMDEFDQIKAAADAVRAVPIFVADPSKRLPDGPPRPEVIAERK